jgi:O-antigen polymerase
MIREAPGGLGWGKFKQAYNVRQAEYFRHHPINDATALRADYVEFAFNEYLQIAVEGGILISFFMVCIVVFTAIYGIRQYKRTGQKQILLFIFGFAGISIAGCFYYILHCWWTLVFFLFCMTGIYCHHIKYINLRMLRLHICTGICGILSVLTIKEVLFSQKLKEAVTLSTIGYAKTANHLFSDLLSKDSDNTNLQIEYALHAWRYGKAVQGATMLEQLLTKNSNYNIYLLLGKYYYQTGQHNKAESCYDTAAYMVPGKIVPRYELLKFYLHTGQMDKAKYWASQILALPIKIPNKKADKIKAIVANMSDSICK